MDISRLENDIRNLEAKKDALQKDVHNLQVKIETLSVTMKNIEKDVIAAQSTTTWVVRVIIGTLILAIVGFATSGGLVLNGKD